MFFVCVATMAGVPAQAASTLESIRVRGNLVCGVAQSVPGFATANTKGEWSGLEVDFCEALAAATLGDKTKARLTPLSDTVRFSALKSGDVDVLARASGWTLSREADLGLRFSGVLFNDAQRFLIGTNHNVSSVFELSGASICLQKGTGAEQGLATYFSQRRMRYHLVLADEWPELVKTYIAGGCSLLTGDTSTLAIERSRFSNPADHVLLPEPITREMLGPYVRQGDEQWELIVRWTLLALITAEELGLTRTTVDAALSSDRPEIRRFLGVDGSSWRKHGAGCRLGLQDREADRQLRGDLRPRRRRQILAEARSRTE